MAGVGVFCGSLIECHTYDPEAASLRIIGGILLCPRSAPTMSEYQRRRSQNT